MHRGAHGPLVHPDGQVTFRVWAPQAAAVELVSGNDRARMDPGERGWFWLRTPAGDDYGFSLDGGPVRPDPASRFQPAGVHERSRVVDPASFPWSVGEGSWRAPGLAGAVFYELHIATFTPEGDFASAATRLERLRALGVTHVEVMPVNAFNGPRGWGYDGVAWYAVHEPYGGPAGFAAFADACHRHGLAVVLDVVYNHLGPSGNYLPEFGPYQTDRYATPWGPALNLDGPGADPVRAFIVDNALMWFADYHVDALRLDAVHGLIDNSAVPILAELSDAVADLSVQLRRPLQLIAESDRCDPATVRSRAVGGLALDGQWADDLHHALHVAVTGECDGYYADYAGLPDVAAAYRRGFVYDGRYAAYRDRTIGAPLGGVPGYRLVGCVQNHDQVGNRALGDRLTALVDPGLARVAILLLCAAPHTPMLFMGDEFGATTPFQYFTSHPEPDLADAVRTGRREEFAAFGGFAASDVPDPQDLATFERSRLDWSEAESPGGLARRALWTDLLGLRREVPALAGGRRDLVDVLHASDEVLVLLRGAARAEPVAVVANTGSTPATTALGAPGWEVLLFTEDARYGGEGAVELGAVELGAVELGAVEIRLPPRSAALLLGQPTGR